MYFSLRLWQFTKGVRLRIALAVFFGLATAASGIARLALLGWFIAQIFEGESLSSLVGPVIGIAGITVFRAVLQYFKEMIAWGTAVKVQYALRSHLYDKVIELGPAHFDRERTGDVTITMVEGVEQLETFFGQYLPQFFTAALTPIGIFIFMAFLDLPVAGIYVGFALLTLFMPSVFHKVNASSSMRRRDAYGAFAADFLDAIQGLATLKAFGQSKARGEALQRRAHQVFRSTMWVLASNAATHGLTIAGIAIGAATALAVGSVRVNAGEMELASLLIVLMLGVEVFRPLRELSQLFHQGLLGISAAEGMFRVLEANPLVEDVAPKRSLEGTRPGVEFRDVHFSYPGGRRPALNGVSFEIGSGEQVGIVGLSGAGKSTLMWLLQRMYEPQSGEILVNGFDTRDLSFDQLRSQMAVVAQDTYLFHGTVADNLRFGNPEASQSQLEEAAQFANAHEFIAQLPESYDTVVGERGIRLSGGQRQRIAIARALLKDAPILILDEALSSVDAENESVIQEALDRLMQGRTALIMAHRLSSVMNTDRILVLEDGYLVESGPHHELLQQGGVYARLMADQAVGLAPDDVILELEGVHAPTDGTQTATATEGLSRHAKTHRRSEGGPTPSSVDQHEAQTAATPAILRAENMGWNETFAKLLSLVTPYWRKLTGSLFSGVAHFTGLIGVGVISSLMVANVKNGEPIGGLMVALLVLAPLTALFTWLESWISHDVAFRLLAEMRITLYRKLDALAPGYLQRRRTGDLVSMATQDVETVEYFFAHTVANAFVAVLVPGGVLVTLLIFGWPLALALLPFLAIGATSPALTRAAIERTGTIARGKLGELNAHAVDTLQGLREIAAFQQSGPRKEAFQAMMQDYIPVRLAFNRQITLQRVLLEVLIGLGGLSVVTVGASLASNGSLDATRLPLLTLIAMGAFLPIAELAQFGRRLGDTLGATRRLTAVHEEPIPVTDGPGVFSEEAGPVGVEVQQVRFSYDFSRRPALDGMAFEVQPGTTLALVGPSGAGKTTTAHLIMRFWDPDSGRIELDNHDLREYQLDELRTRMALVAQDTYLFNASIRDNLLVADPEASGDQIRRALDASGLSEFVATLPDGLDTVVGERGMQLSGGQRQRVAIGRAVLRDAPLLILDEATSHLDAVNEKLVRDALERLMVDRTTLVIAHRLSTVRDADQIVVLEEGKAVEIGTHTQLMRREGLYARLVGTQITHAR